MERVEVDVFCYNSARILHIECLFLKCKYAIIIQCKNSHVALFLRNVHLKFPSHMAHVESIVMLCEIIVRQSFVCVGCNLPKMFVIFLSLISKIRGR